MVSRVRTTLGVEVALREVFAQLKQDGTLSKLSQKWIGADISQ